MDTDIYIDELLNFLKAEPEKRINKGNSSSEAKQAQPQCLCGVAPFFLYGVMRAILHFRLYFFRNNFRIAYLRNGLDLLRKVVLLVIIRLAAL